MFTKFPKDDHILSWTRHIKNKMMFYGLSESKIRRILKSPKRREEGIAPRTMAAMQRNDRAKKKEEIWVMYQTKRKEKNTPGRKLGLAPQVRLISAWRYPGISKAGDAIPIPDHILADLAEVLKS